MTQFIGLDIEAAEKEGLTLIRCRNRNCSHGNPVLALQTADGHSLRFNQNARSYGSSDRVRLTCECGVTREWRPSRGAKHPVKPSISTQSLKSS